MKKNGGVVNGVSSGGAGASKPRSHGHCAGGRRYLAVVS